MAMEDCTDRNRKRARDDFADSASNSAEAKLIRVDAYSFSESKLSRLNSSDSVDGLTELVYFEPDPDDSGVRSPEAKRIQDDLLNMLDEADAGSDPDPAIQGLDSFIRSFEEEILVPAPVSEITLDSGESQPDLGYLLEASDDELGLPPSFFSGTEQKKIETIDLEAEGQETVGLEEMMGFGDHIPSYDSFELGFSGGNPENSQNGNEFVALGSLFDHTENCEPSDISGHTWRPESLSTF